MSDREVTIIEATTADRVYWRDVWKYRELLVILAWRDVAVRYKQTAIGLAWALLKPLATALVFTTVFGRLAGMPSDGTIPYALLVLAGTAPWMLMSSIVSDAADSLVVNAGLISKVYFPRIITPLSPALASLVDFTITPGATTEVELQEPPLGTLRGRVLLRGAIVTLPQRGAGQHIMGLV